MNMTINKTRIRPSINIGPDCIHHEKEGRHIYKQLQSEMIEREITDIILDHVGFFNDVKASVTRGHRMLPEYDKESYAQGDKYWKCAFVAACLDRDYNMALYWIRKAWASFDHESYIIIEDRHNEHSYISLFTHVYNDSEWAISAKTVTRSFLGVTETYKNIGTIKEEADLTPVDVRLATFDRYITFRHKQATHSQSTYADWLDGIKL
jgi:hypothetical protein